MTTGTFRRGSRMSLPDHSSGVIAPLVAGFVILAVVVVVVIGWTWLHVIRGVTAGPASTVAASLVVELTPVDGGTDVRLTLTADATGARWPQPLALSFARRDSGQAKAGPALTGDPLDYSRIEAGSGARVQAATGSPGFAVDLPTDGRSATISFRVATVAGVRAVRPVPVATGVRFTAITVHSTAGRPECQRPEQEVGVGYPDYVSCQIASDGTVLDTGGQALPADGVRNAVRLVLP